MNDSRVHDMKSTKILENSVSLLKRGWCQIDMAQNEEGGYASVIGEYTVRWCAYGAILCSALRYKMGTNTDVSEAANILLDANQIKGDAHIDDILGRVAEWNDADGRTQEDVVSAFENAVNYSKSLETRYSDEEQ